LLLVRWECFGNKPNTPIRSAPKAPTNIKELDLSVLESSSSDKTEPIRANVLFKESKNKEIYLRFCKVIWTMVEVVSVTLTFLCREMENVSEIINTRE
jgi:hypothetical protein